VTWPTPHVMLTTVTVMDTQGDDYAHRLVSLSTVRWKRWLDVQAPYRWNLRRQDLGVTLDVGCGWGRNLLTLPPGSMGVDHNVALVAEARRLALHAVTSEEWESSSRRVPQSFDSLLFAHVIEHMDAASALALVQAYRPYLKVGGTAFFICPQERGYSTDPTHVRFVDLAKLAELARDAGLTPVKSFSFPFPRALGRIFTYNEFCLSARLV
jgi:hypothetical protein